jgi:hypothetical protein
MAGLEIVDVALGLTLVYLLLASICSLLRERFEAVLKTRAVNLERGIREMLQDADGTGLAKQLYDHPLIDGLFQGSYNPALIVHKTGLMPSRTTLPSYIPARNFAVALLDVVGRQPTYASGAAAEAIATGPLSLDLIRNAAVLLDNTTVQRMMLSAIDTSKGELDQAQANLEAWFNSAMDRLSGQYRRRSQLWILILSLIVSVAVNANTLTIIERLSADPVLRQTLVEQAQKTTAPPDAASATSQLDQMGLPLGWADGWPGPAGNPQTKAPDAGAGWDWLWYYLLHPIIGLLLTAFAVSLGAPFWFDALNKFIAMRSTFKPGQSDDKSTPAGQPAAPAIVQVQLPQAANTVASSTASYRPHEWAQGNPQEGVL